MASSSASLFAAWDASLARLSAPASATEAAPGPSSVALAESIRAIEDFLTPLPMSRCAWKDGYEPIKSHADAVVSQGCQSCVAETYIKRCELAFAPCALPILDSILHNSQDAPSEIVVERALIEIYNLMLVWRDPLRLEALDSGKHIAEFEALCRRLLRATLTHGHLTIISGIMKGLVNGVAQRSTINPGAFMPSSRIWIELGIADIAFTSLVSWSKSHLTERIRALATANFTGFAADEFKRPLVRAVLEGGPFVHRVLPTIHALLRDTYIPIIRDWLQYFAQNSFRSQAFGGDLEGVVGGMYLAALETLSSVRSRQIFDIVVEFPASQPAMLDLKDCLHLPDAREIVIADLSQSIRQRLLNPGAQTSGIILTYLRMVSALRLIDESGVILSRTAPALRRYLRSRSDTVSAIVTALVGTDPDFESLREELRKETANAGAASLRRRKGKDPNKPGPGQSGPGGPMAHLAATNGRHDHGGDDEGDAEEFGHFDPEHWKNPNWHPRPVDAGLNYNSTTANDIVNMLVSIFDEEAHFVTALEHSTATELIKVKDYAPENELHNNLILKKRFGEAKLARCDVMLNDFPSSRRIDHFVHERIVAERKRARLAAATAGPSHAQQQPGAELPALDALHPLIVSRQFWPSLEDGLLQGTGGGVSSVAPGPAGTTSASASNRPKLGMMKMPGQLGVALEEYARIFAQVKSTRKVLWLGGLGSVDVEIEMDDGRIIREACSPAQAAVVEIASARAADSLPITMEELVVQLEADKSVIAAALQFWTAKGVLRELDGLPGTYETVEQAS